MSWALIAILLFRASLLVHSYYMIHHLCNLVIMADYNNDFVLLSYKAFALIPLFYVSASTSYSPIA